MKEKRLLHNSFIERRPSHHKTVYILRAHSKYKFRFSQLPQMMKQRYLTNTTTAGAVIATALQNIMQLQFGATLWMRREAPKLGM